MSSRTTLSDSGLKQAISWLVDEKMFSALKRHGNTDWSCSALVTMALLAPICESQVSLFQCGR